MASEPAMLINNSRMEHGFIMDRARPVTKTRKLMPIASWYKVSDQSCCLRRKSQIVHSCWQRVAGERHTAFLANFAQHLGNSCQVAVHAEGINSLDFRSFL